MWGQKDNIMVLFLSSGEENIVLIIFVIVCCIVGNMEFCTRLLFVMQTLLKLREISI